MGHGDEKDPRQRKESNCPEKGEEINRIDIVLISSWTSNSEMERGVKKRKRENERKTRSSERYERLKTAPGV